MTVIDLAEEFAAAVKTQSTTRSYGSGRLLTLPWALADGESVTLYVEQFGDDVFHITDRGMAADALALAGVDLGTKGAASSWAAVKRQLDVPTSVLTDVGQYELAGSSDTSGLGVALASVAEAVLRADGLRVLSNIRPRLTFPDRVIRHAHDKSLAVIPRAPVPTRFGATRSVTCRVEGKDWAFVQALSAGSHFNEAYDHARSIFGDAREDQRKHLVAIVAEAARPEPWQLRSLKEHSKVILEREQDDFFASLAA